MSNSDQAVGPSDFSQGPVPISSAEVDSLVSDVLVVLMERVHQTCGVELVEEDDIVEDASRRLSEWFNSHFAVLEVSNKG